MNRIYTIVFVEPDIDIENDGSVENALNALKNGDLKASDLEYLAAIPDSPFSVSYNVIDE
jgi:hypothetical protein